ncbi:MAG: ribonuclease H family protein [Blautia sp.]|nr:ribonuclease H family protein [Blautia sp.]
MGKKKKFYAVRKGLRTGLYDTWEACEQAVKGYSGAEFKSFASLEEAKAYLAEAGVESDVFVSDNSVTVKDHVTKQLHDPDTNEPPLFIPDDTVTDNDLIAYVDGSYDHSLRRYGYGCVLLTPDGEKILSGSGNDPGSLPLRNVAGEMLGAMHAVQWAIREGYTSLEIRYDYEGIEKWVTGKYRAMNERTQQYAAYMRGCASKIRLSFKKVRAHSGDTLNDKADQAARGALHE